MTEIVRTVKELNAALVSASDMGSIRGFVPTMGALHAGHIALVERAMSECDVCVCSIFVNPVQFNNPKDLETYPRTEEEDVAKLKAAGAHIIFIPEFDAVYPNGVPKNEVDFGDLAKVMEGANRPGHFDGVGIVVRRLFELVSPDKAYFGKKDYQQLLIVQRMVDELKQSIEIVPVDIVREDNGLAMSSRNMRLSADARQHAGIIRNILQESTSQKKQMSPAKIEQWVVERFEELDSYTLEYFTIASSDHLGAIVGWDDTSLAIGFVVVHLEGVRLIDNIEYL